MADSYPNGQKTLWEKEKLLVTSNFSFSHSVFKRFVSQRRQKVSLCGNGLKKIVQTIPVQQTENCGNTAILREVNIVDTPSTLIYQASM